MAARFLHRLLFAAALPYVLAIQVTPNSPCSSVCVDSTALDLSDPNSSNTVASSIVCEDADYTSTSGGKKWTQCMTCLQSSTFVQGGESDQYWFLCKSSLFEEVRPPTDSENLFQTTSDTSSTTAYTDSSTERTRI